MVEWFKLHFCSMILDLEWFLLCFPRASVHLISFLRCRTDKWLILQKMIANPPWQQWKYAQKYVFLSSFIVLLRLSLWPETWGHVNNGMFVSWQQSLHLCYSAEKQMLLFFPSLIYPERHDDVKIYSLPLQLVFGRCYSAIL